MDKNKKKNIFWYSIGIGAAFLIILLIISAILNIGERLRGMSKYVEYGFYALAIILVIVLIIYPVCVILFSPSFSVVTTLEEDKRKNHPVYKKVAQNLVKNNHLNDEEITLLTEYKDYNELRLNLNTVFNNTVKKQIDDCIKKNAKTVMISTAISQNSKLDSMSVLAINIRLIKEIVETSGFRPNYRKLSKLTIKVLSTALIAENLENLDLSTLLPNQAANFLNDIPFVKTITSSFTQGISNALLTIRVGIVTRKYLFEDGRILSKKDIRLAAFKDSLILLPIVIGEVMAMFPKKLVSFFNKKKDTEQNVSIEALNKENTENPEKN